MLVLATVAVVLAIPHDESIVGALGDANNNNDNYNPEDFREFFKLKKFKKIFFG